MMTQRPNGRDDGARDERAQDWERTAFFALGAATTAALVPEAVGGRHAGDVVLAAYLTLVGVGLWIQAIRMKFAPRTPRFTPNLSHLLAIAFAVAVLLGIADLASSGRF